MLGRISNASMRNHFFVNHQMKIFKKKPPSNRFKKIKSFVKAGFY